MSHTRDSTGMRRGDVSSAGRLSYQMIRTFRDGAYRMVAMTVCAQCGEQAEILANMGNDPGLINRKFQARGWEFTPYDAAKCICLRCKTKRRDAMKDATPGKSENKVEPVKNGAGPPLLPPAPLAPLMAWEPEQRWQWESRRRESPPSWDPAASAPVPSPVWDARLAAVEAEADVAPVQLPKVTRAAELTARATKDAAAAKAVVKDVAKDVVAKDRLPRDPTPNEKAKVRLLLDHHFDDAAGRYLDGYSDQRIGEETEIPWASVKLLREAAYGPLREDPVILEIRGELKSLRSAMGPAIAGAAQATATVRALEERLTAAEEKLNRFSLGARR